MKALVSNGTYKFHLAPLASELNKNGLLAGLVTAGWPMGWQRYLISLLPKTEALYRYLDRREPIDDKLVFASLVSEAIFKAGDLARPASLMLQHRAQSQALKYYEIQAANALYKSNPSIYHYRCGYGGNSVKIARALSIPTICDHSIAHPHVTEYLIKNRGQLPKPQDLLPRSILSRIMSSDILQSENLLVNSDFVKLTCELAGYPSDKIFVVYWGIDDKYLSTLPPLASRDSSIPSSLLYVGGWQERKGVETLIDAIGMLSKNVRIEIAGGIEPELTNKLKHKQFLSRPNVFYHGVIRRNRLYNLFSKHSIFVFPSYCEGSARVIFEAMAAGCYVITTPNAGSIVNNGEHGAIVEPGNPRALLEAIEFALLNPHLVSEIGLANAKLIREKYTQASYLRNVLNVYSQITSKPWKPNYS